MLLLGMPASGLQTATPHADLTGQREHSLSLRVPSFSSEDTNPIMGIPSWGPHPHKRIKIELRPKGPSPKACTLGVRAWAYKFEGDTIQSIAHSPPGSSLSRWVPQDRGSALLITFPTRQSQMAGIQNPTSVLVRKVGQPRGDGSPQIKLSFRPSSRTQRARCSVQPSGDYSSERDKSKALVSTY